MKVLAPFLYEQSIDDLMNQDLWTLDHSAEFLRARAMGEDRYDNWYEQWDEDDEDYELLPPEPLPADEEELEFDPEKQERVYDV